MSARFPRFALLACTICLAAMSQQIRAADGPAATPPASPEESLKQIEVDPGLKVELIAHEPDIMSPIAVRFDEEGRLWVVQMCDYPTGARKTPRSAPASQSSAIKTATASTKPPPSSPITSRSSPAFNRGRAASSSPWPAKSPT